MSDNSKINELPDPATFAAPEDGAPKKRKRRPADEPGPLAITSLMDIMTIILVFLLKSYSSNPVQLKQAKDLKLPFSSAQLQPAESTAITVTLSNILVGDDLAVKLDNGVVADSDLTEGMLIDPLFSALQDSVDHQKKVAKYRKEGGFSEVVTIISDRQIPFRLISQVMYSAGQAQFAKFKFAVIKRGG